MTSWLHSSPHDQLEPITVDLWGAAVRAGSISASNNYTEIGIGVPPVGSHISQAIRAVAPRLFGAAILPCYCAWSVVRTPTLLVAMVFFRTFHSEHISSALSDCKSRYSFLSYLGAPLRHCMLDLIHGIVLRFSKRLGCVLLVTP